MTISPRWGINAVFIVLGLVILAPADPVRGDVPETFRDLVFNEGPVAFNDDVEGYDWFDHFSLEFRHSLDFVTRIVFTMDGEAVCEGEFQSKSMRFGGDDPESFGRVRLRGTLDQSNNCPSIDLKSRHEVRMLVDVKNDLQMIRVLFPDLDLMFNSVIDNAESKRIAQNALSPCSLANWIDVIGHPMALIRCDLGRAIKTLSDEQIFYLRSAHDAHAFMRNNQLGVVYEIDPVSPKIGSYELICLFDIEDAENLGENIDLVFIGRVLSFEKSEMELRCQVLTLDSFNKYFGLESEEQTDDTWPSAWQRQLPWPIGVN